MAAAGNVDRERLVNCASSSMNSSVGQLAAPSALNILSDT